MNINAKHTKESILLINERDQVILDNRKLKDVNEELLEALKNALQWCNDGQDDKWIKQAKQIIKKLTN